MLHIPEVLVKHPCKEVEGVPPSTLTSLSTCHFDFLNLYTYVVRGIAEDMAERPALPLSHFHG